MADQEFDMQTIQTALMHLLKVSTPQESLVVLQQHPELFLHEGRMMDRSILESSNNNATTTTTHPATITTTTRHVVIQRPSAPAVPAWQVSLAWTSPPPPVRDSNNNSNNNHTVATPSREVVLRAKMYHYNHINPKEVDTTTEILQVETRSKGTIVKKQEDCGEI